MFPSKSASCMLLRKKTSHMLKIGRKMTNIPDLSDLPIITRRYIETAILQNVFDEIKKRFDS